MNKEHKARCLNFGNFTLEVEKRLLLREGEPVPLTPKAFDTPRTRTTQLTNNGQVLRAAVSPDGKYVAYIQNQRGQESLWVRQVAIAGGIEIVQPGGSHYVGLTFSSDSNSIFHVKCLRQLSSKRVFNGHRTGAP